MVVQDFAGVEGKNGAWRARKRKDNITIATNLRALHYLPTHRFHFGRRFASKGKREIEERARF